MCGGAPAVSGHNKALQGALGFHDDHAKLPRLPRVLLEALAGFVHVRGGEKARARRCKPSCSTQARLWSTIGSPPKFGYTLAIANVKKKGERAREQSSGELAVMATMVTMTPARTRTANSPTPWLACPCN